MTRRLRALLFGLCFFNTVASAQQGPCACPPVDARPLRYISDNNGAGTGTATWSCDTTYVLTGPVFVNPGHVLTIQPGTVVQGRAAVVMDTLDFYVLPNGNPSPRRDYVFSQEAGSLIVARGAQIYAEGTASCPIVFTYEGDPLDGSSGYDVRGKWGGLIVCGRGTLNTFFNSVTVFAGTDAAEGVIDPTGANRHLYGGGANPTESSGVLKYISLRHGSTSRGINQFYNGNETNLLQLCGVGSGTTVDYIETIASADDGLQIMGGLVDIRHIGMAFNAEEGIEFDQGWQGRAQHLFCITDELNGAGEHAGDYEGDDWEEFNVHLTFMPYTTPEIFNQTYIGRGGIPAIRLHNGGAARMHNSLFVNFSQGIDFEDYDPCDAWELLLFEELLLRNNRFWDIGDSTGLQEMILYDGYVWNGQMGVEEHFLTNGNGAADPMMDAEFAVADGFVTEQISPFPTAANWQVPAGELPTDPWFDAATYWGAFEPGGENWLTCWTYMEHLGLFGSVVPDPGDLVLGCTYSFACNFNPEATDDDGSCEITSCAGCTDPVAQNYDAEATLPDGSCSYVPVAPVCPEDLDGNGVVGTSDLLVFLAAFGDTCPE
jgi:hypothetical protein